MKQHFLVMGLLAAMAVPASAQGVYIFGDVGRTKLSIDAEENKRTTSANNFSFGVGYAVNQYIAFEAASRDLGSFTTYEDQEQKTTADVTAVQVSVIGTYPINAKFSVFGHAGVSDLSVDADYKYYDYPEENDSSSESKHKSVLGFGGSYAINDHISLRAAFSRYAKWEDVARFSTVTFGGVYSF